MAHLRLTLVGQSQNADSANGSSGGLSTSRNLPSKCQGGVSIRLVEFSRIQDLGHAASGREAERGEGTSTSPSYPIAEVTNSDEGQAGDTNRSRIPGQHAPVLFLLPGSVGYGPSLAAFAIALGSVARVVPIRYPALSAMLSGANTLGAMADAAIDQIAKTNPTGHVRLLGHSLGGAVAFEVASRLLAAGRSVKFLGILDTSILSEQRDYRATLIRTIRRLRTDRVTSTRVLCRALAKVTVSIGYQDRLVRFLDRRKKTHFNATAFRIKQEVQEVLRARAFFSWLAEPRQLLPLAATLFRCHQPGKPLSLGWDSAFVKLQVIPVSGGHLDLVAGPHLAANHPLIEAAVAGTYTPAEMTGWDVDLSGLSNDMAVPVTHVHT